MDPNLMKFKGRLPYASEIFGVYQPLLGWKSRLIQKRLSAKLALPEFPKVLEVDAPRNTDHIHLKYAQGSELELVDGKVVVPGALLDMFANNPSLVEFQVPSYLDSLLVRSIQEQVKGISDRARSRGHRVLDADVERPAAQKLAEQAHDADRRADLGQCGVP